MPIIRTNFNRSNCAHSQ